MKVGKLGEEELGRTPGKNAYPQQKFYRESQVVLILGFDKKQRKHSF